MSLWLVLKTICNNNQCDLVGPKKSRCGRAGSLLSLLAAGVLGHGFGALAHSVLGKLTRQEQTDGSLDLPGGESGSPVVVCQTGGLGCDALEDVVHKRVHDRHGLAADASVGVHLLQHLVDVDGVALPPPLPALLVPTALGLCLRGGLLGSFRCCGFRRHVQMMAWQTVPQAFILRGVPILRV